MKIRRFIPGIALTLAAATIGTAQLDAQSRAPRAERDRSFEYVFPGGSLMVQGGHASLGVYVDVHQPTRYDERGARLTGVQRNSAADDAGLEAGDIVTAIDGQSLLRSLDEALEEGLDPDESLPAQRLRALLGEFEDGDEIEVEYIRDGESYTTTAEVSVPEGRGWFYSADSDAPRGFSTLRLRGDRDGEISAVLEKRAWEMAEQSRVLVDRFRDHQHVWIDEKLRVLGQSRHTCPDGNRVFFSDEAGCVLGAEIREIEDGLAAYFDVEDGLLVMDAADDNAFGLEAGDVVVAVGDREVTSFRRLRRLIDSYEPGERATLTVVRNGRTLELETTFD